MLLPAKSVRERERDLDVMATASCRSPQSPPICPGWHVAASPSDRTCSSRGSSTPSTPDGPPCVADSRCSVGEGDAESQWTGKTEYVFRWIISGESLRIRDSFNLFVNDGLAAGQVIFHTHLHIIPWKAGDQLWPFESFRRQPIELKQEIVDLVNTVSDLVSSGPRTIY